MKTLRMAMLATLLLTACDFDVGDLNRPGLDTLQKPTVASVQALATGLLIGARKGVTERVGLVVEWGILGREALVLTPSDPRFVNELLQGSLDPGSNNFGGNFWVIPYSNIDRKSTRLNSSHGYISYAVFCLKKKKNKKYVLRNGSIVTSNDEILERR